MKFDFNAKNAPLTVELFIKGFTVDKDGIVKPPKGNTKAHKHLLKQYKLFREKRGLRK